LPEWVKPVGLGIAVLGAAYLFAKKRR
jgi:hypothetical protein